MSNVLIDIDAAIKQYIGQELDTRTIAKIHGTSQWTIIDRLKKSGIKLRNCGHKRLVDKLSDIQVEIINGELLGDGSLSMSKGYKNARFQWGGCSYEHGEFLHLALSKFAGCFIPDRQYWKITSKAAKAFTELRQKWYPNGKQEVPEDIELTPTVVRHFYIGDGNLRKRKNRRPSIRLFVNNYNNTSLEILLTKFMSLGFNPKLQSATSGFALYLPTKETNKFFDYVGTCPFNFYQYKWP